MKFYKLLVATIFFVTGFSANAVNNVCGTNEVLDIIQENLESVYDGSSPDSPKILSVEKGWTVTEKPLICKVQVIFEDNGLSGIYKYAEKTNRNGQTYFEIKPIKTNYDKQLDRAVEQMNKDTDATLNEMDKELERSLKEFN